MLKELNKKFKIYEIENNIYQVYDHKNGKRTTHKYLVDIEKIGKTFKIIKSKFDERDLNFLPIDNTDELVSEIYKYVDSLPYDSEYYNSLYRDNSFIELIVHDFLTEKGFENPSYNFGIDSYILKRKNIYHGNDKEIILNITDLKNSNCDEINVSIVNDNYSWVESKCKRNPDDIIEKINNLLKPLLLSNSARDFSLSEKFTLKDFDATIKKLDTNNLEIYSKELKEELKEKLQNLISKL